MSNFTFALTVASSSSFQDFLFNRFFHLPICLLETSLIGRFLLIFDNFENVYLFSNPNISAKTHMAYTKIYVKHY